MDHHMEIEGKTALVTGGASGIGLACVRELLKCGAKVAICDCNQSQGETVLKDIVSEFEEGRAIFILTDVTKEKEFEDAFKLTVLTFQTLDIVLNNAGINGIVDWEKAIDVNLSAVVRGIRLAHQYMSKNNGGRGGIVCNTASIAGLMPVGSLPVYCATKHGVIGLTRSYGLPMYTEESGVRVVAICPGVTITPFLEKAIRMSRQGDASNKHDNMSKHIPQKAEDVATAVMVVIKTAESGTIWVSEMGNPVYEVVIPEYSTMKRV